MKEFVVKLIVRVPDNVECTEQQAIDTANHVLDQAMDNMSDEMAGWEMHAQSPTVF